MAFSDKSRWERALEKGIGKGICKKDIRELCEDNTRVAMYLAIRDGRYTIVPPHTAQIPKDDGTFRTVYVNEPKDRVLLSLVNDLLFEVMQIISERHIMWQNRTTTEPRDCSVRVLRRKGWFQSRLEQVF